MQLSNNTANYQQMLANYCRTGNYEDIPGINTENIKQYRRLVFNVVYGNIEDTFPILNQVVSNDTFTTMVNDFFSNHDCQTPQIWKLSRELLDYSRQADWSAKFQLPWLDDLLLLEHTENEVFTMPDIRFPAFKPLKDIFTDSPALNPEYKIINLQYPVHLIPIKDVIPQKGQYHVLIFRHPQTKYVRFFNISTIYKELIGEISVSRQPLQHILTPLSQKFRFDMNKENTENIRQFLLGLYGEGFILGGKNGLR